jgi:alpha-1,3-glucosyltransferase
MLTINSVLYKSTDFEVHRNWLAITYSLPFHEWYKEARNIWTLDYPPFFAYFEYALSLIAQFVDPNMLSVDKMNYESYGTILFQRASVIIISDLVLALCVYYSLRTTPANLVKGLIITLFSSALFVVDHIHFQYNGMMLGMLVLSAVLIEEGRFLLGAFLFSFLIFFKHIYLYAAPVFFVYCLGRFVVGKTDGLFNFFKLATVVVSVALIALVPLIVSDQLPAALERMFPFGRGLVHSYWAPNTWAIYLFADRVLGKIFGISSSGIPSSTQGLVQVTENAILPTITPATTLMLTLAVYIPFLLLCVWRASRDRKIPLLTLVAYGNAICFFFGWHIHEKAILMVTVPLVVQSMRESDTRVYVWMFGFVSCMSLLPLLPRSQETVLKWTLAATGALLDWMAMGPFGSSGSSVKGVVIAAVLPEFFRVFVHGILMQNSKYEFLPLMLTSVLHAILLSGLLVSMLFRTRDTGPKRKY